MNHESHIGLIDTHAEGYGRNNHLDLVFHPAFLDLAPSLNRELGVIELTLNSMVALELLGQEFTVFLREAVNYPTFALESAFEHLSDVTVYISFLFPNFVEKIGPIETALEVQHIVRQA